MSPINGGICPLLLEKETNSGLVYYCSDYKNRPEDCKDHDYPASICPIGVRTLKLIDQKLISDRMADIYSIVGTPFAINPA
jgi:hypothetical protein